MRHVLLQQVDHPGHLTVDENPVAALLQSGQQTVQDVELPAVRDEALSVRDGDT